MKAKSKRSLIYDSKIRPKIAYSLIKDKVKPHIKKKKYGDLRDMIGNISLNEKVIVSHEDELRSLKEGGYERLKKFLLVS